MEVMIPLKQHQNMEFDFTSAFTTPYSTAPSTPKRFGHLSYINSAPASPNHTSEFYNFQYELNEDEIQSEFSKEDEFAFEFSEELEKTSLSADELFDGGKIKSLLNKSPNSPKSLPKSPISQGKKMFHSAFSSKQKNKQIDDSESTLENTIREETRGRDHERFQMTLNPNSNRRSARSLSPYIVSQHVTQNTNMNQSTTNTNLKPESTSTATLTSSSSASSSSSSKSKRWSLKEFFLFRSASEGRASDKDPLKKYSSLFITNKKHEDVKNSSFRSAPDSGSVSKRRAGQVSAHEMHYNMNRAAAFIWVLIWCLSFKKSLLVHPIIYPCAGCCSSKTAHIND